MGVRRLRLPLCMMRLSPSVSVVTFYGSRPRVPTLPDTSHEFSVRTPEFPRNVLFRIVGLRHLPFKWTVCTSVILPLIPRFQSWAWSSSASSSLTDHSITTPSLVRWFRASLSLLPSSLHDKTDRVVSCFPCRRKCKVTFVGPVPNLAKRPSRVDT